MSQLHIHPAAWAVRHVEPDAEPDEELDIEPREAPAAVPAPEPALEAGAEAVGFGRPPKAHQFAKGRSGNPQGRPRRARIERARDPGLSPLEQAVSRRVEVELNGRRRRVGLTQAVVGRLIEAGLEKGELVALRELLRLCGEAETARARRAADQARTAWSLDGGVLDLDALSSKSLAAMVSGMWSGSPAPDRRDEPREEAWEDRQEAWEDEAD
jgi:hypothetical protein